MENNICLNTDSYKQSHFLQYPEDTEKVYSYIEARGGSYPQAVFFGAQMLARQLADIRVTESDVVEAEKICNAHGVPFNLDGWKYILNEHNGKLPIEIKAVPEGSVVPTSNILMSIENTDPKCFWLTSFLETMILRAIWYPTTVATLSHFVGRTIYKNLVETSDDPDGQFPFKLHDFGARGVSSRESSGIGGLAHLVTFMGTDTMEALRYAREFYGEEMAGFSIPAAEHSTITSWGRENEEAAYRNMLKQFAKPESLVAVVSDSYDIYNACSVLWGEKLKQDVLDSGATVVVRPDSGDIVEVTEKVVRLLAEKFGTTINLKGYSVLHPSVRVIQGDGCSPETIAAVLENLKQCGFSGDNIAFGMGAGLLQKVDRDTLKFAMKCSAIKVKGELAYRPVYKQPITDPGKDSKKGRMTLVGRPYGTFDKNGPLSDGMFYQTAGYPLAHGHFSAIDMMRTIFRNGEVLVEESLDDIRARAKREMIAQMQRVN